MDAALIVDAAAGVRPDKPEKYLDNLNKWRRLTPCKRDNHTWHSRCHYPSVPFDLGSGCSEAAGSCLPSP